MLMKLEDTARYAGILLAPAGQKSAYYAVFAHFWHFLVYSTNLGNLQLATVLPSIGKLLKAHIYA